MSRFFFPLSPNIYTIVWTPKSKWAERKEERKKGRKEGNKKKEKKVGTQKNKLKIIILEDKNHNLDFKLILIIK